jgi:peptide chain release factor subunit 3
MPSGISCQV